MIIGVPSLQSAILQTNNLDSPRHRNRWFEADASYKVADYFDKYYGSGKYGYESQSKYYFDIDSFKNGNTSKYDNPRNDIMFIMKYFRCLSLVFVLFLVSSCFNERLWKWLFPDDEHTLEQKEYTGDNLRIDGFYCYEPNDDEDHTYVFVLYKNGVVMGPYGTKYSIVEEKYFDLIKYKNKGYYIDIIDWWGLFEIENSSIYLEYHMPSMYGHHTYLMKGEILNDTTFHMTKGKQSDSSDYESIDQMYHFHKMRPNQTAQTFFFIDYYFC